MPKRIYPIHISSRVLHRQCAGKKAIQTQDHADITKPFAHVSIPVKSRPTITILNTASSKANSPPKMPLSVQQSAQPPLSAQPSPSHPVSKPAPSHEEKQILPTMHGTQAPTPTEGETLEAVQYVQSVQQTLYLRGDGLEGMLNHCGVMGSRVMSRENREWVPGRVLCVLFSCRSSQVSVPCLLTKRIEQE